MTDPFKAKGEISQETAFKLLEALELFVKIDDQENIKQQEEINLGMTAYWAEIFRATQIARIVIAKAKGT